MTTGFINVNKPSGAPSSAAVNKIKKLLHTPCGHMGTLDPLASGVLPVGVGNAARLFDYFLSKKKVYLAEFTFGVTSDTLDSEGQLEYKGERPKREDILDVIPSLIGEVDQIPPRYSAKCVNGKRGYQLAREGKEFTLAPKRVLIESISLCEEKGEGRFTFEIVCGGGTYIRSIARDMGEKMGTFAIMSALRRTQSGVFTIENSVPQNDLTEENIESFLIPTDSILPYPTLEWNNFHIFHGLPVKSKQADGLYKVYDDNGFYGIAEVKSGQAVMKTKLC